MRVPADERPSGRRSAVRVVVRDDADAVLMLIDSDPGAPGASPWLCLPGGGIEPGESPLAAAVRELREETGLVVGEGEVVGPVARREVLHGFSDKVVVQDELLYAVTGPRFELDVSGWTPEEQETVLGHEWVDAGGLVPGPDGRPTAPGSVSGAAPTPLPVWPPNLAELVAVVEAGDAGASWPVALPRVDESTVAADWPQD